MSLNDKYLHSLAKYPLMTKSATAGLFCLLNEALASCLSGEYRETRTRVFGKEVAFKHVLSPKIAHMVIYGSLIATPISHYYYGFSNRVFRGKLSPKLKLVQLFTSLTTLTPLMSSLYVSWLALINSPVPGNGSRIPSLRALKHTVLAGLKKNFWLIYRTSAVTSLVSLTVAQNFVPPELWVVFFNVIYFVVGTIQNTKIKIRQRNDRAKKLD